MKNMYRITFETPRGRRIALPAKNFSYANILLLALREAGLKPVRIVENGKDITIDHLGSFVSNAEIVQRKLKALPEDFCDFRISPKDL